MKNQKTAHSARANTARNLSQRVRQAAKGDQRAIQQLYEQHAPAMLTTAYRITNNLADAEDVIQEGFVRSFQQLRKLQDPAAYSGWLKRIIVNLALQKQRKRRHFAPLGQLDLPAAADDEPAWYQSIPFARIQAAIQDLPNGSREVLSLYLLEGYKHREIAEWLNISVSTSKSQYQYALRLLRQALQSLRHE
ncbi:MAG: RNA polymerase sigma factor [Bacteroidota bacterium]